MASSGDAPLVVSSMLLTLHCIYDMPEGMARRADGVIFDIVLHTTAKIYVMDQKVTCIELVKKVTSFRPQDITCRNNRFELDLDALARAEGAGGASSQLGRTSATTTPSARNSTSDGFMTSGTTLDGAGGGASLNELLIPFPSRPDLKSIVEVSVGVRERYAHSSSVRWLTTPLEPDSRTSEIATFAAAEGEVARHKNVIRFVGLVVGHLASSLSLPYANDDLTHVRVPADHGTVPQAFTDGLLLSARKRLEEDQRRLLALMRPRNSIQLLSPAQLDARLANGESEWLIYRNVLLECDPAYFVKRVQNILDLYPPTQMHLQWVQRPAEELVSEYAGRELVLIRNLCAELGPELNSISPRTRRLVFSWLYHSPPREDMVRCVQERFGDNINFDDFLDNEPDLYMSALCAKYGPELPPTRYYFPMIEYSPDSRPLFRHVLPRCVQKCLQRGRSAADRPAGANGTSTGSSNAFAGAGAPNVPSHLLELTPHERPLRMLDGTSSSNEIDILSNKYTEECEFLIKPITMAITEVVGHDSGASKPSDAESLKPEFSIFNVQTPSEKHMEDMVRRCAMYSYISPSTLVAALIFLDRLCLRYPKLVLTWFNIQRLFATMARIASKVVDLRSINNKNFARVFEMPLIEFNKMEDHMLKLMQFDFMLTPEEFNDYATLIHQAIHGKSTEVAATTTAAAAATTSARKLEKSEVTVDSLLTDEGSPARAESVPATARVAGSGRRTSVSGSLSGMVPSSMPRRGPHHSERAALPTVANSFDATLTRPSRSVESARVGSGKSAQFQNTKDIEL